MGCVTQRRLVESKSILFLSCWKLAVLAPGSAKEPPPPHLSVNVDVLVEVALSWLVAFGWKPNESHELCIRPTLRVSDISSCMHKSACMRLRNFSEISCSPL